MRSLDARPLALAAAALAPVLAGCGSSASTTGTASSPAASTAAVATPPGTRAVAGSVVSDRFGENQVTLVLRGTTIVDVRYTLPSDRERSVLINRQAGPLLRQEVLKAQSASIDLISGATYTSDAFIKSLQVAERSAHPAS